MSSELPLKLRVDVRDLWTSPNSELQSSITSLEKVLGYTIDPVVQWSILWDDLKDHFPDKATFIPSIARIVNAWYDRLQWRLDSDNFPEWTEELLTLLSESKKQLIIEASRPPHTRPKATWDKKTGSFLLTIPKTEPLPLTKVVAAFDTDFEKLLDVSGAADEGWDDVTAEPKHAAPPSGTNDTLFIPKPQVDRLPTLGELPRPNDLFVQRPPYILTVDVGSPLLIRCSHEPSLELIVSYFNRWGKLNTNDTMRRNVLKVEMVESGFHNGVNDVVTIEPAINYRNSNYSVNPVLLLSFIEGVLGYKEVYTNGHTWVYRSDTILK